MNEPFENLPVDLDHEFDLEVRITALVLDEASDLEREQLERLMERRPELAALKSELERLHGLLGEVGAGDLGVEEDWKLSDERRLDLFAKLSASPANQSDGHEPISFSAITPYKKSKRFTRLVSLAAVFLAITGVGFIALQSTLFRSLRFRRFADVASARVTASDEMSTDMEVEDGKTSLFAKDRTPEAMGRESARSEKFFADNDRWDKDSSPTPSTSTRVPSRGLPAVSFETLKAETSTPDSSGIEFSDGVSADFGMSGSSVSTQKPSAKTSEEKKKRFAGFDGISGMPSKEDAGLGGGALLNWQMNQPNSGRRFRYAEQQGEGQSQPLPELGVEFQLDDSKRLLEEVDPFGDANQQRMSGKEVNQLGQSLQYFQRQDKSIEDVAEMEKQQFDVPEQSLSDSDGARSSLLSTIVPRDDGLSRGSALDESLQRLERKNQVSKGKVLEGSAIRKTSVAPVWNEIDTNQKPFSTFSLHVSDVSFKLAAAALAKGEWPDPKTIRMEEFVNAFDYGDPLPSNDEAVACQIEQSIHPFLQQRNLLRVSLRTAAAGRAAGTPLRLTFLLDNSGSMERLDRQRTVRKAFRLLAGQLQPNDQVTLISFARQPRLLADKVSADKASDLVRLIESLPSEGGTNIESALQLAYEKASEQYSDRAQNRIILLTDGAANLGDAEPESLANFITTIRDAGIAFDAAGISADGLNDDVLEALTRKGDGRYYLLDSADDADAGFVRQIAGALRPSAKNVKVQIEFNPQRVSKYKLMGFEKHRLKKEDFLDDAVDAAEMGAAEAGVAVYQFAAMPEGHGDIGSVSVRFQDLSTGEMVQQRWPISYQRDAPRPEQATASMRIATVATLLATKLSDGPVGETVRWKMLSNLLSDLPENARRAKRLIQMQQMIEQARTISER